MWNKIKLFLTNKSLIKKFAFTLMMLLIFRLLVFVPIPFYNRDSLQQWIAGNDFFAILNNFGGNALEQASFIALGITPYITASIIVQMLEIVIPQIKEWKDQGEAGQKKSAKVTKYVAVGLAFAQGLMLIIGSSANAQNVLYPGLREMGASPWPYYLLMALCITAGTCVCIWISNLITKHGVGNGASLLITAGIVVSIPSMGASLINKFLVEGAGEWYNILYFIIIVLVYLGVIFRITFIQQSSRKIPVQYANRQGKSRSDIPLSINAASVMPVIFASTIMSIPLTVAGFFEVKSSDTSGAGYWLNIIFNNQKSIGFILYLLLIVIFAFFYTFMQISPEKMATNLSKSNAFIPATKPGEETQNFIARILFKVTVIGTIYLIIIASIPILLSLIFSLPSSVSVGGTSLLIVVGVAIETVSQLASEGQKDEYQGLY